MVGKPACQSEIQLEVAWFTFCAADFTWAPCQDTVYTVSIQKCFSPKLKALQDACILSYHSLASDNLTFLCFCACLIPLSLLLFFFASIQQFTPALVLLFCLCFCLSSIGLFSVCVYILSVVSASACLCICL